MTAALLLPLLAAIGWTQDAPPPPQPDVYALINLLDSDDSADRERASEELARIGQGAVKALQRAAKNHRSPEVRARAAAILDALDGGGPVVNGLKLYLSADRKTLRPGDRVVLTARIVNRTAADINLYVGYSTGGPDFESGSALQASLGGAGRWTAGFCGTGAGPIFATVPAGGEIRYEAPATFGVDEGKPYLAFRWYRIDLARAGDLELRLEHAVDHRRNSDQGHRGFRRGPDNDAPFWTGEIKSNLLKLQISLEMR
jgi:hypothetical protein